MRLRATRHNKEFSKTLF